MKSTTVNEVHEALEQTAPLQLVDVRSATEFASGHVPGAMNIPLEQVAQRAGDLQAENTIVLICQSGKRAEMAREQLQGAFSKLVVMAGGTSAWKAAGYPVVQTSGSSWALERQVRLGAGALVLSTLVLAKTVSPKWLWATAFIGAGLTFAGATNICGMGMVLAKMPWNRKQAPACGLPAQG
jgi:Rhodanese-related sulfurtransferase